jgi:hypothetical protein
MNHECLHNEKASAMADRIDVVPLIFHFVSFIEFFVASLAEHFGNI